jgi:Flp pilus assembly protein TadB
MCNPVAIMVAASVAGTAASIIGANKADKAAKEQANSLRAAEEERKAAEARAQQDAQMARADQRRRMRGQSFLAAGADQPMTATGAPASTLSYGKATLGG